MKKVAGIFFRYLILILVAVPNLFLFYKIFTPLTVYSVSFFLSFFYSVSISQSTILLNNIFPIELIPACIAGSAYYLLLILNLSTPNLKIKNRIASITISFFALLVFNVLRISFLVFLLFNSPKLFAIFHKFIWYFMSVLLVILIWFFIVKIFKIKEIPFYSDAKKILNAF